MNIKLLVLSVVIGFTIMSSASAHSRYNNRDNHQKSDRSEHHQHRNSNGHQQVDRHKRFFSFHLIVPSLNYYSQSKPVYRSRNHYYNQRPNKYRNQQKSNKHHRHYNKRDLIGFRGPFR